MKILFLSESEFDLGIHEGRFFKKFESLSDETDEEIYRLGRHLQEVLSKEFGKSHIFVSDEVWLAYYLTVEVTANVFQINFVLYLLKFLKQQERDYCVGVTIYGAPKLGQGAGKTYLGRIFLSNQEIVVENSVQQLWDKNIRKVE